MKLNEFVRNVISDVLSGIKSGYDDMNISGVDSSGKAAERLIDFDVAVTVTDEKEDSIGAGAVVSVLGIGAKRVNTGQSITESRIRFSVPVLLPPIKTNAKQVDKPVRPV